MKSKSEDELISNLKEKIDSFIQKGISISKGLSVNERDRINKKIIDEIIDKALEIMTKKGKDIFAENELNDREKKLRQIIEKHYQKRIDEMSK